MVERVREQRVLDLLQIGRLRGGKVRGAKFKVMHLVLVDDHFGEIEQRQHRAGQVEIAVARRAEVVVKTPGGNGNTVQLVRQAGGLVLLFGIGECIFTASESHRRSARSESRQEITP